MRAQTTAIQREAETAKGMPTRTKPAHLSAQVAQLLHSPLVADGCLWGLTP
jgi:hypothetical protein